jgi:hypothetical protein
MKGPSPAREIRKGAARWTLTALGMQVFFGFPDTTNLSSESAIVVELPYKNPFCKNHLATPHRTVK